MSIEFEVSSTPYIGEYAGTISTYVDGDTTLNECLKIADELSKSIISMKKGYIFNVRYVRVFGGKE